MAEEDQEELRGNLQRINLLTDEEAKQQELSKLFRKCHMRAKRMVEILDSIESPSASTIGEDGCEAVLLITQHSYLPLMKKILGLFEEQRRQKPGSVPIRYIPSLRDRIMVLESRKQMYGTQWRASRGTEVPFLVPVEDFPNVNKRRAEFGLKAVRKPINLAKGANKYPLGKGLATADDQKELTDEEYHLISLYSLESMV